MGSPRKRDGEVPPITERALQKKIRKKFFVLHLFRIIISIVVHFRFHKLLKGLMVFNEISTAVPG